MKITTPEKPISKRPLWLRVALSLFIVYHLAVISILANGSSFLGRTFQNWMAPYANLLGLNVTWNFFAPDPAHTMYIQYVVHFEDESGAEIKEPLEAFIPPEKEKLVIDTSKRRLLYAMRFLITDEKRMKMLLAPYLCREHQGASSVHIRDIIEPIPNLDLSSLANSDMRESQQALLHEYRHMCNETMDEVDL